MFISSMSRAVAHQRNCSVAMRRGASPQTAELRALGTRSSTDGLPAPCRLWVMNGQKPGTALRPLCLQ